MCLPRHGKNDCLRSLYCIFASRDGIKNGKDTTWLSNSRAEFAKLAELPCPLTVAIGSYEGVINMETLLKTHFPKCSHASGERMVLQEEGT